MPTPREENVLRGLALRPTSAPFCQSALYDASAVAASAAALPWLIELDTTEGVEDVLDELHALDDLELIGLEGEVKCMASDAPALNEGDAGVLTHYVDHY